MLLIKKPILGFENNLNAKFKQIDNIFALLEIDDISIPLLNPYVFIKNYSFEIPTDVRVLLDIDGKTGVYVFVPFVKNKDIDFSITVTFKAITENAN